MLLLALMACEPSWAPGPAAPPQGAVVVVGMDGLDRQLLEERVAGGHLPTFARLMEEGLVADLQVDQPIISPRIWTSLASGYPSEVHGIHDWVDREGQPYSASSVQTKRVWDIASEAGHTVLVSGWLMTTPVSPVEGVMLGDELVLRSSMDSDPRITPQREHREGWLAYPASIQDEAQDWTPGKRWVRDHALGYQVEAYDELHHPLLRDETHLRSFEALLGELQPQLSLIYLSGADQLSHRLWPFVEAKGIERMRADPELRMRSAQTLQAMHPSVRVLPFSEGAVTEAQLAEGARWIHDYYAYLDEALARILAPLEGTDATLIVLSDHGFRINERPAPLFADHENPALLLAWGSQVRPVPRARVDMLDLAPTLLALLGLPAARDMPGQSFFALDEPPRVDSYASPVETAVPDVSQDFARQKELEALGYIDAEGKPIPQPPR